MSEAPLLALVGPTAAGKSEIALELAAGSGREIVAVDSRLVYRGLDIGTAKPDRLAQGRVPHHMIDLVDPGESYDAMRYAQEAGAAIEAIRARGSEPLLEGGTGFYLRALLDGGFDAPGPDHEFRRDILEESATHAPGWLHEELARVDPETAARLHPRDSFRLVRALEITRSAGRRSAGSGDGAERPAPRTARLVVLTRSKAELDRRIADRWTAMLRAGLVEEVRGLMARGYGAGHAGLRTPGYREVIAHLSGELTWGEACEQAIVATRRYAKRQLTWFRHQAPGATWIDLERMDPADVAKRIEAVRHA